MHLSTLTIPFAAVGLVSSAAIPQAKRQLGSILDTTDELTGPDISRWLEVEDVDTPNTNTPSIIGVTTGVVENIFDDTADVVTTNVNAVADGVNGAVEDIFDVGPAFPEEKKKKQKRQLGSVLDTTVNDLGPAISEWVSEYDLTPVVNSAYPIGVAAGNAAVDIFEDTVDGATTTVGVVADGASDAVVDIFDV